MAMLRALSVRSHRRYERLEQLVDEPEVSLLGGKLPRTTSVPAQFLSRKLTPESAMPSNSQAKSTKKSKSKSKSKSHPLFSLFDGRRHRRKTTAKPEFARYLEYVKEGGVWDLSSNMPVIYYK